MIDQNVEGFTIDNFSYFTMKKAGGSLQSMISREVKRTSDARSGGVGTES